MAFQVLAEEGFAYDSSQHDSPRLPARVRGQSAGPHRLALERGAVLWEFPLAVWRPGGARLPVGGASYWALMPTALIVRGLAGAGELAGLYLHPHELDPLPLRVGSPEGGIGSRARVLARLRELQRNSHFRRALILQRIHDVAPDGFVLE